MTLPVNDEYVFIFAHPDDDSFIAGTMHMLVRAGAGVHAIWLTSGDFLGQGSFRERELRNAGQCLGLPDDAIHLLRIPDLGLIKNLDTAADRVAEIFKRVQPDTVFSTAYEGGHPDHDSANFIAYEALRRAGRNARIMEFPLYNGAGKAIHWWWKINAFPDGYPETRYNPLTEEALECKYRLMRIYWSQFAYMIPARLACSRTKMLTRGEPYRVCPPDRDHTAPPHPGTINYHRWFNAFMRIKFKDFAEAVREAQKPPLRQQENLQKESTVASNNK